MAMQRAVPHHKGPSTTALSWEQVLSVPNSLTGVLLARSPDGKTERNLVDEVSKVVHQVERGVLHAAHQVSEKVAERVDGPTHRDDEAHGVERGLHMLAHLVAAGSHGTGFAREDLVQDEPPSGHASGEASPSVNEAGLPRVAEGQHGN